MQKTLEHLHHAIGIIHKFKKMNPLAVPIMGASRISASANTSWYVPHELLRYQVKLYEGLASVYNEAYFYQTAKGWMIKAKHLR